MDAGHVGQLPLVVSLWGVGGAAGVVCGWTTHVITFLAVCSCNSRDAFSGFGGRLSAILSLANGAACPETFTVPSFQGLIYVTSSGLTYPGGRCCTKRERKVFPGGSRARPGAQGGRASWAGHAEQGPSPLCCALLSARGTRVMGKGAWSSSARSHLPSADAPLAAGCAGKGCSVLSPS